MVYFVRHGEVENPERIKYGRLPGFPLTAKGAAEAQRLAEELWGKGIQAIFCSPLLRTRQTAQPIAQKLGLGIIFDDRLLERDHGKYTGSKIEDYLRGEYWRYGGETLESCGNRVIDFLDDVKSQNKYRTITVVGHEGPIIMAILNLAGKTEDNYDSIKLPMGGFIKYEF